MLLNLLKSVSNWNKYLGGIRYIWSAPTSLWTYFAIYLLILFRWVGIIFPLGDAAFSVAHLDISTHAPQSLQIIRKHRKHHFTSTTNLKVRDEKEKSLIDNWREWRFTTLWKILISMREQMWRLWTMHWARLSTRPMHCCRLCHTSFYSKGLSFLVNIIIDWFYIHQISIDFKCHIMAAWWHRLSFYFGSVRSLRNVKSCPCVFRTSKLYICVFRTYSERQSWPSSRQPYLHTAPALLPELFIF